MPSGHGGSNLDTQPKNTVFSADARIIDDLRSITKQWFSIEGYMKSVELETSEILIPSINELRYAGRRLACVLEIVLNNGGVLNNENYLNANKSITEIRNDLDKASQDLADNLLYHFSKRCDLLKNEFGMDNIVVYFPDFLEKTDEIFDYRNKIIETRTDYSKKRSLYAILFNNYVPRLIDLFSRIERNEDLLLKAARKQQIIFYVTIFGIAGGLASIISLF